MTNLTLYYQVLRPPLLRLDLLCQIRLQVYDHVEIDFLQIKYGFVQNAFPAYLLDIVSNI